MLQSLGQAHIFHDWFHTHFARYNYLFVIFWKVQNLCHVFFIFLNTKLYFLLFNFMVWNKFGLLFFFILIMLNIFCLKLISFIVGCGSEDLCSGFYRRLPLTIRYDYFFPHVEMIEKFHLMMTMKIFMMERFCLFVLFRSFDCRRSI